MELLERNGRIEAILLSARNVVRQRLLMCCFIDSVWSRCTPRYVTVVWKGMQLPSISADSQPTKLIRTDEPTSIISVFSVLSFSLLKHPWQSITYTGLNVGLAEDGQILVKAEKALEMPIKHCLWGTCSSDSRFPQFCEVVRFVQFAKPTRMLETFLCWSKACGPQPVQCQHFFFFFNYSKRSEFRTRKERLRQWNDH